MGPVLRVATLNVLNDRSRWPARRALVAEGLAALSLDVITLQEIIDPLDASSAHWLAEELGGYSVHVCPKAGWSRKREGIAILSRLRVERHETLDLRGQERMAQLVRVPVEGGALLVVNTHLVWPIGAHATRLRQLGRLLEWVGAIEPAAPVVVCGDFNATPDSPAVALMRRSFASAHETVHGREPQFTCPTPLVFGGRIRGAVTRGLLRLFTNRPGATWQDTLDYIFVSPGVRVVDCAVMLDQPAPDDATLYASDHVGLAATLELPLAKPIP